MSLRHPAKCFYNAHISHGEFRRLSCLTLLSACTALSESPSLVSKMFSLNVGVVALAKGGRFDCLLPLSHYPQGTIVFIGVYRMGPSGRTKGHIHTLDLHFLFRVLILVLDWECWRERSWFGALVPSLQLPCSPSFGAGEWGRLISGDLAVPIWTAEASEHKSTHLGEL